MTRGTEDSREERPKCITFGVAAFHVIESAVFSLFAIFLLPKVGDDVGDGLLPFLEGPKNFWSQPEDLEAEVDLESLEFLEAKSARPGTVTCFRCLVKSY